jgi:hypothetical protein
MTAKRAQPPAGKAAEWIWQCALDAGKGSYSLLSSASGLPISTLNAILKAGRRISPRTWSQLAAVIRPGNTPARQFTERFLELAGYKEREKYLPPETRLERVFNRGQMNAIMMTSEPFVMADADAGFAVELANHVASVMGVRIHWEPQRGKMIELSTVFERNPDLDLAVTAVLPTFRKSRRMAFSKPFPFLRIGISAVIHKKTAKRDITISDLLDWESTVRRREKANLGEVRFAYAKGGAADDFVSGLWKSISPSNQITLPEPTVDKLLGYLCGEEDVVVIADIGTCEGILQRGNRGGTQNIMPVPRDPEDLSGSVLESGPTGLESLARYPVTFALPMHDKPWEAVFNSAMDFLLSERIRLLLRLYHQYQSSPIFRSALADDDPNYPSPEVQRAFGSLKKFQSDGERAVEKSQSTSGGVRGANQHGKA